MLETELDINLLLNKKYIGADLYQVSFPEVSQNLITYNINLSGGYNFFHLLSGEVFADTPDINFSIDLASSNLSLSGTAGSSIDVADVIWQRQGIKLEGAWLKSFDNERRDVKMYSRIVPGQNTFRFPFPGKGLSSVDLGWTGHSLENISRDVWFTENSQNLRENLTKLYWNTFPVNSSCDSIDIHQTSLIDAGAFASKKSQDADRIYFRPTIRDGQNNGIYNGEQRTDFLYDFTLTQLPISEGENKIYFPLVRLSQSSDDDVKPEFQMHIDQCDPIKLSDIDVTKDMAGAVASLDITKADMIFKKTGYCGDVNEAAWLSGAPITVGNCAKNSSKQPSLYSVFNPGIDTRFVYALEGGDNLLLDRVFYGLSHDPWCPYLNLEHVDYLKNSDRVKDIDYDQASKCKCKATWFSPCGHSESFIKFWKFTDIIYLDPQNGLGELASFSPESWRDRNGKPWNDSNQIAYFEYSGIEPNVGWGTGKWKTGNGEPFFLQEGEIYVYRRTDINSCGTTPPLILNRTMEESMCGIQNNINKPIWAKAIFVDGQFINGGIESDMVLKPTDYIVYNHKSNHEFTCTMISSWEVTSIEVSSSSAVQIVPVSSLGGFGNALVSNIITTETQYSSVSIESEIISSIIVHEAPSFLWSTDLTKYNPRPYWAQDPVEFCVDGQTTITEYDDYIISTLPTPSNLVLTYDSYFSYQSQGSIPFVWSEDIVMRINENKPPIWMKIDIIEYGMNTWENVTNQKSELKHPSVWTPPSKNTFTKYSATDIPSDMILESRHNCGFWSEIIYCAKNPFTWVVTLSSTMPLIQNAPNINLYINADFPWRNVKNIYEAKYKILDRKVKKKTKKGLGVLVPERTAQDILRGKNITIEYVGRDNT